MFLKQVYKNEMILILINSIINVIILVKKKIVKSYSINITEPIQLWNNFVNFEAHYQVNIFTE